MREMRVSHGKYRSKKVDEYNAELVEVVKIKKQQINEFYKDAKESGDREVADQEWVRLCMLEDFLDFLDGKRF